MKVKTLTGAAHAYACISGAGYSLDVKLAAGRSASSSLEESAKEAREKAARLVIRAERMEQAADYLRAER